MLIRLILNKNNNKLFFNNSSLRCTYTTNKGGDYVINPFEFYVICFVIILFGILLFVCFLPCIIDFFNTITRNSNSVTPTLSNVASTVVNTPPEIFIEQGPTISGD